MSNIDHKKALKDAALYVAYRVITAAIGFYIASLLFHNFGK